MFSCPYGVPGDRLWVRETFREFDQVWAADAMESAVEYAADNQVRGKNFTRIIETQQRGSGKWKPSIFMPRWASRITLEITEVRVQRVQEISEEDALEEGAMEWWNSLSRAEQESIYSGGRGPCGAFHDLWDSINAKKHPWSANPWVWALTFKNLESNTKPQKCEKLPT